MCAKYSHQCQYLFFNRQIWRTAPRYFCKRSFCAYAYNLLQETFFQLFILATRLDRSTISRAQIPGLHYYSLAMWHTLRSDRQQRDLAIAAITNPITSLDIDGGTTRLKWAREQANTLADYRNLIIHAPMRYTPHTNGDKSTSLVLQIGGFSTKRSHRKQLDLIKSPRFWKALRNDLLNLNDYVDFVTRQIAWCEYERQNGARIPGARRSWPHKPRLPCVRRIEMIRKTIDRQAKLVPLRGKRRPPSGGPLPNRS